MAVLYFSDLLKKIGLNPSRVMLIRHALSDNSFRSCYDKNMVLEYTRRQKIGFSKNYDYWAVFISESGTHARFFALYKVIGEVPDTPDIVPPNFPHPEWFQGENSYFDLEHIHSFQEYEGRLTIEWGKSTQMWHQKGSTEKPVLSIDATTKQPFPGFENTVLSYDMLKEVANNSTDYELWQTALSSINAVYLITDTKNGLHYVGSAYGKDGLLGRWRCYVDTMHGNNKSMVKLLLDNPDCHHYFQFSILQIFSKATMEQEIIQAETLWKKKLLTLAPFGLNEN